jgi:hypothetical protein
MFLAARVNVVERQGLGLAAQKRAGVQHLTAMTGLADLFAARRCTPVVPPFPHYLSLAGSGAKPAVYPRERAQARLPVKSSAAKHPLEWPTHEPLDPARL